MSVLSFLSRFLVQLIGADQSQEENERALHTLTLQVESIGFFFSFSSEIQPEGNAINPDGLKISSSFRIVSFSVSNVWAWPVKVDCEI